MRKLIFLLTVVAWLGCDPDLVPDPPAEVDWVLDCNKDTVEIVPGDYYRIFRFGRWYVYRLFGNPDPDYYFTDGGAGFVCTRKELEILGNECDIKHLR